MKYKFPAVSDSSPVSVEINEKNSIYIANWVLSFFFFGLLPKKSSMWAAGIQLLVLRCALILRSTASIKNIKLNYRYLKK